MNTQGEQPVDNRQTTFHQPQPAVQTQVRMGSTIRDPNEPGISLDERVERQRLFYETKLQEKEQEKEDALVKRLEADADVIRLRDEKKALEQKNRIIENQYTAQFRRGVNTEVQQLNTPEGLVREAYVKHIEEKADFARKVAPIRNTYMLI